MPATNNPRGFVEFRSLNGNTNPATHTYRARQTSQGSPALIRPGDPVVLVSGNRVARMTSDGTGANAQALVGVVRAVYDNTGGNRGLPRPKTFSLPSNAPVIGQAADGWVEVNIDPFQTYIANVDTTASDVGVGLFIGTTVHNTGTVLGRSGFGLELDLSAQPSTDHQWQVIDFSPLEIDRLLTPAGALADLNADYEVRIAIHAFNGPYSVGSAAIAGEMTKVRTKDIT